MVRIRRQNCCSGWIDLVSYGSFGDLNFHVISDFQDEAIVLYARDGTIQTSQSHDFGSRLQCLDHFVVLLLLFALRGNDEEPHSQEKEYNHQELWRHAWRLLAEYYKWGEVHGWIGA